MSGDPGPIPAFLDLLRSPQEREAAAKALPQPQPKGETDVKPGPKEEQLRAFKARRTAARASRPAEPKQETTMKPITLPTLKTLASPIADGAGETDAPTETAPEKAPTKPKKSASPAKPKAKVGDAKKRASAKTKTPKKTAAPKKAEKEIRPGSKLELIHKLLTRPQGCTSKQVLDACKWPAVSMPQQARALGVKLKKEKVDGVTVYRAA